MSEFCGMYVQVDLSSHGLQNLFQSIFLSSFVKSSDPLKERKTAMKLMAELMRNCVAADMSWAGQRGKQAFSKTQSWKAVKGMNP